MGNVKIKQKLLYPVSHDASVLHDLCSMRDDDVCKCLQNTIRLMDYSHFHKLIV